MSEDAQDVTTETPADDTVAEVTDETPAADTTDEQAVTADTANEPAADTTEEAAAEAAADDTPEAETEAAEEATVSEDAPAVAASLGPVRVARVFVCERGHRTTTLWGEPATCQARPFRNGAECGLQLYHITELPEQVQKALNPLKASKKASKKK